MSERLGLSGRIARRFLDNQITPLLAIGALLMGLFAVLVTPREEEPQIDVTFANIFVPFPGASAVQVENLVASPLEKVLGEISGVKHISSVSRPGMAVLSVQFEVGEPRTEAIVRLYNAIYSNQDWQPADAGILQPLIKPKGIDDVPILTLTLWTQDTTRSAHELGQVARSIEAQIKRAPGTRNVYTVGDPQSVVRVELDPQKLSGHGLTVDDLLRSLQAANIVRHAGTLVGNNQTTLVDAGQFLADRDEVASLIVGSVDGKPIFLEDVARVTTGPDQPDAYVWFGTGPGAAARGLPEIEHAPAVTIAVSKKPGENAIDVANGVIRRIEQLKGSYIPQGIEATVTRNYGVTANDKAKKLIQKLLLATTSVVLLVVLTMGRREALVVGAAVIVTLAATLFASWAWGFTINRVSLFALIFSIGILVDDAIVVVENIHRHMRLEGAPLRKIIPYAVDEVGGPTILATFTVIAALLPMAFVSGLMGPYMSPIPINASMGMLISLAVALVFTPWLCRKLLEHAPGQDQDAAGGGLRRVFERLLHPFLGSASARHRRHRLYAAVGGAILIAMGLVVIQLVVLKMLPFDDKSEFQIIVNLPEGTTLETTAQVLTELSHAVAQTPEVSDYQVYAGTAAPINFNGLVRQYYLRTGAELGDLQVNLVERHDRSRKSHDIARAIRPQLAEIGKKYGASVQVVEVPPGPPVLAPLVAEIYGPDPQERQRLAAGIRKIFESTPDIVDVDDSLEAPAQRWVVTVDRQKAALLGVSQHQIVQTLSTALSGTDATYIHGGHEHSPIPVRLELGIPDKANPDAALSFEVRAADGTTLPLSELVTISATRRDAAIHHKDLLPVTYVTGDMAGRLDSPLYGMFSMVGRINHDPPDGIRIQQRFVSQPDDADVPAIKWDGEWQITYETFRDMGMAYSVGLILIYLLVVAQFRSYALPLIIMVPIPLTIIGVMPGHALLGAEFTATSMIGMIALAGIIVRNSILLVDFVDGELRAGASPEDAVIRAGAIRAKPIALTAVAAMAGAFFILDDPIFNGLAVSLIFGILVSTVLTLVVVPVLYYAYLERNPTHLMQQES
ncbi:multidrug transporter AcrB [Steroidobacter denitrificans]|uniref:Multidrug transporter AcrB n=1 Tax=Steroidobacter denitrificans TaxID=465721 RepID=A0A127F6J6_STEDE|nr:efflux RND transporter permease subunit [Steroidobacter denitrificans]AMN46044.1 multidrug transporter AcrB [Steroidobacter denitrificans]